MSVAVESQKSTMKEKTDEDFLEAMQKFPALFDKSKKNHSDRDITNNGWKSIAELMNVTIDEAKKWWARLLREYRNERSKQDLETRSGNGAIVKREMFSLYYTMKDMLMNCHTSGNTYSNYTPSPAGNDYQQTLSDEVQGGYNFQKASGRSKRKADVLKEAVHDINSTLEYGYKLMEAKREGRELFNFSDSNDIIGSIIESELERMEPENSRKKRQEIHKRLSNYENEKENN